MSGKGKRDPFAGSLFKLFKIREDLPIIVQGITVRPGDAVLVTDGEGAAHTHVYAGVDKDGRHWTRGGMTTAPGEGPGPYRLEDFRHPDLLTGFINEVDVKE